MANLFGRLFKGKKADQPQKSQQEAYFLDADSAKTLGNIDYMRKPNVSRRTFPKTMGNTSTELIQEISALERKVVTGGNEYSRSAAFSPKPAEAQKTPDPDTTATQRRRADNNLDMFRNMARDIKKP
ncbi:MAG: hypothetical protein HC890_06010 [Chloroflexaceae bacterium]|nr:hypothetical protein [Chloroflexaceae bacterium]